MNYFSVLPTIDYNFNGDFVKMKNIFYSLNLEYVDDLVFKLYRINGIKRIDTIAYELYGTTDYWWLIALINNIKDIIFDLPIEEDIIRQITTNKTKDKYGSITTSDAINYYNLTLSDLIEENDGKRLIRVIDKVYISRIITDILKRL